LVLGLDFDGTLAPIVADPALARPDAATLGLLAALAGRVTQLVLISGRDTRQLAERVPLPAVRLIGNHGLEESLGGQSRLSPVAEGFTARLAQTAIAISALPEARLPGVRIENKRAAISVHFREANDRGVGARLEATLTRLGEAHGLRLHAGRFVWELRPAVEISKGSVVTMLAATPGARALVYAGDDLTDADAFAGLRRVKQIRTVAVGVLSGEVPAATFKDCDLLVDGVEGVKSFLSDLLAIG
jgi:trehalose 6-phosphate phosphatase